MTIDQDNNLLSGLIDRDLAEMIGGMQMPENVSRAWRVAVKEEPMKQNRFKQVRYWLAAAAALAFVLVSTGLTRDADISVLSAQPESGAAGNDALYKASAVDDAQRYAAPAGGVLSFYGNTDENRHETVMETYGDMDMEISMSPMPTSAPGKAVSETAQTPAKRIVSVDISLTTLTFDASLGELEDLVKMYDGYAEYQNTSTARNMRRVANLNLRIPEERLDSFVDAALSAGSVTGMTRTETDVTENYRDSATRLATQEEKLSRLRALMTETAALYEVLQLETEIAETQYTIDRLRADLLSIDRQVAYSRVSIVLREEVGADALDNQDLSLGERIVQGILASLAGIRIFLGNAAVFAIAALPFMVIAAAVWLILAVLFRRIKRRKH
jgi:hypothetical protein